MISTEHLCFGYGASPVLEDLTVGVREGAVTSLLGANGCGKSTLLKLMTKNLKPDSGSMSLRGQDIGTISLKEFARQAAIVHQNNSAPDDLTVERLVSYGRLPYTSVFRLSLDEDSRKQVDRALALTDLTELRNRRLGSLSGGQRQRAFIAMALAQNTNILFLDEPTTFLDVRYQVEVLQLVRRLNREQGMTIVMVLHDINQALSYSDELIGLKDGRVAFQGAPEEVVTPESIRDLYGIRLPVLRMDHRVFVPAVAEELEGDTAGEKGVIPNVTGLPEEEKLHMDNTENEEKLHMDNTENKEMRKNSSDVKLSGSRIVRASFIILGILCVVLGSIGVVLPVLPTTPFLLAAAFCFAKSSERLNRWLKGTRLYRSHLETFHRGEGMTLPAKLRIIAVVTAVMAVAEGFMLRAFLLKGSKGALIGCVTMAVVWVAHLIVFFFVIKTCPPERAAEIAREREEYERTVDEFADAEALATDAGSHIDNNVARNVEEGRLKSTEAGKKDGDAL